MLLMMNIPPLFTSTIFICHKYNFNGRTLLIHSLQQYQELYFLISQICLYKY
nr:MAG TPA: hypothetical protein [Caudoviricetes sp.]